MILKHIPLAALFAASALTSTQASGIDGCITGNWRADIKQVANTYWEQLNMNDVQADGSVSMNINIFGEATISIKNLTLYIELEGEDPFSMTMNGQIIYDISSYDDIIVYSAMTYGHTATAIYGGELIDVKLDDTNRLFNSGEAKYRCTATELTFANTDMPGHWIRLPE